MGFYRCLLLRLRRQNTHLMQILAHTDPNKLMQNFSSSGACSSGAESRDEGRGEGSLANPQGWEPTCDPNENQSQSKMLKHNEDLEFTCFC